MTALQKSDAQGWIEWSGGACPVPEGALVDVRHRDGDEFFGHAAMWDVGDHFAAQDWSHTDVGGDIVAYRMTAA